MPAERTNEQKIVHSDFSRGFDPRSWPPDFVQKVAAEGRLTHLEGMRIEADGSLRQYRNQLKIAGPTLTAGKRLEALYEYYSAKNSVNQLIAICTEGKLHYQNATWSAATPTQWTYGWELFSGGSWSNVTGLQTSGPFGLAQAGNDLFICHKSDNTKRWNGTALENIGWTPPWVPPFLYVANEDVSVATGGWSETDTGSYLSYTTARLQFTLLPYNAESRYYKSYGAGNFVSFSFTFQFKFTSGQDASGVVLLGCSNTSNGTLADWSAAASPHVYLIAYRDGTKYYVALGGSAAVEKPLEISVNTDYYATWTRRGTQNVFTVFSDVTQHTLVGSIEHSLTAEPLQYLYLTTSVEGAGAATCSGYIEDINLGAAALGAGSLDVGTYSYYATYGSNDAAGNEEWESMPSPICDVVNSADNKKIVLAWITTGPTGVDWRKIYRAFTASTELGARGTAFQFLAKIEDNTTTTYTDDALQSTLGDTIAFDHARPPKGDIICTHRDHVFMAGISASSDSYSEVTTSGLQNRLYHSRLGFPYFWPGDNYIDVGDDTPIVALVSFRDWLIIIKSTSMWLLAGSEGSFILRQVDSTFGATDPCSVAASPQGVVWTTPRGLVLFDGENTSIIYRTDQDYPFAMPTADYPTLTWHNEYLYFLTDRLLRWNSLSQGWEMYRHTQTQAHCGLQAFNIGRYQSHILAYLDWHVGAPYITVLHPEQAFANTASPGTTDTSYFAPVRLTLPPITAGPGEDVRIHEVWWDADMQGQADTKLEVETCHTNMLYSADSNWAYGLRSTSKLLRMNLQHEEENGRNVRDYVDTWRITQVYTTSKDGLIFITVVDQSTLKNYLLKSIDRGDNFGDNAPDYDDGDYVLALGDTDGTEANQIAYVQNFQTKICEHLKYATEDTVGWLFVGEYNVNGSRVDGAANDQVRLMRSVDEGDTWEAVGIWNTDGSTNQTRHIHGVCYDKYDEQIYVLFGDTDAQSGIIRLDGTGYLQYNRPINSYPVSIGGGQKYRAIEVISTHNYLQVFSDASQAETASRRIWRCDKDLKNWVAKDAQVLGYPYHTGGRGIEASNGALYYGEFVENPSTETEVSVIGQAVYPVVIATVEYVKYEDAALEYESYADYLLEAPAAGTPTKWTFNAGALFLYPTPDTDGDTILAYEYAEDWQINVYASGDEGNTWQIVGKVGAADPTSIKTIFEWENYIWLGVGPAAGKSTNVTTQCYIDGYFDEDEPIILQPVFWVDPATTASQSHTRAGWFPDFAFDSLNRALYSLNKFGICRGARVKVAAGVYAEPAIQCSWADPDGMIPDAYVYGKRQGTGAVVIEGAGRDQTIIYAISGWYCLQINDSQSDVTLKDLTWYHTLADATLFDVDTNITVKWYDCTIGHPNQANAVFARNKHVVEGYRTWFLADNQQHGFNIETASTSYKFHSCLFYGTENGFYDSVAGVTLELLQCTFYNYDASAVVTRAAANTLPTIKNCIAYSPIGTAGSDLLDTAGLTEDDAHIDYNLYGSGVTGFTTPPGGSPGGTHRVVGDPLFISAALYDFSLQSTSPAIAVGVNGLGVTKDLVGKHIPCGIAPCMGALEHGCPDIDESEHRDLKLYVNDDADYESGEVCTLLPGMRGASVSPTISGERLFVQLRGAGAKDFRLRAVGLVYSTRPRGKLAPPSRGIV